MPNRRYHIHVVCADNDQTLVLDRVAIFFQMRAFLTYDVCSKLPQATLYGRQCIEACDYVLMIVGDSYGTTQSTGVSQMHLSYLNAKAKLKPLLILVKNQHENADVSRHMQDFRRMVEQQAKQIYYYDTNTYIEKLLTEAYDDMLSSYGSKEGWVRADKEIVKSNKQAVSAPYSRFLSAKAFIKQDGVKQDSSVVKDTDNCDILNSPINLTDTLEVQYSAQAYEGGNLTDVTRLMTLSWQEVLHSLTKIPATFSSYGLQSCINRLIAPKADYDIKEHMPNVHAVSRCQIAQSDLNNLQRLLVAANWIQLTTYSVQVSPELWMLTFYAKSLFDDSQLKASAVIGSE